MPDPTPAATYRLFSWLRQGLLAGITNATGPAASARRPSGATDSPARQQPA